MPGASACAATRLYFSSLRYEDTQFLGVFVVYSDILVGAKGADLAPGHIP